MIDEQKKDTVVIDGDVYKRFMTRCENCGGFSFQNTLACDLVFDCRRCGQEHVFASRTSGFRSPDPGAGFMEAVGRFFDDPTNVLHDGNTNSGPVGAD